ncbi:hypothetical protein BGS_0337 [Beggiatoa sp. SS]|nr:hypothetical protein BGS_0337 [Beggiatoa sp. SS]
MKSTILIHCPIPIKKGTILFDHLPQSNSKTPLNPAGGGVYSLNLGIGV